MYVRTAKGCKALRSVDTRQMTMEIDMATLVFYEPDDLASSKNIRFEAHPLEKRLEPVIVGDLPDEEGRIGFYGTVFRDPWSGKFRMWYTSYHPRYYARYAESDDGIEWTKPSVRDSEWVPDQSSNAAMPGQFPVIIPHPDAEEPIDRYWLFMWSGCMNVFRSSDGIRWERHPARWNPVWPLEAGEGLGEVPIPFWDPDRREYIAMTRIWTGPHQRAKSRNWDPDRQEYTTDAGSMHVRMIGRGTSPDGIFWTGPDIVYNCDGLDPLGSQPYEFAAWPYAGRHLGLVGIIHSGKHPDKTIANTLRLYLAWSTDGCYTWNRLPDRLHEFVPLGPPGAWDSGMITQPTRLVEVDDEWRCYYGGHRWRHVATADDPPMDGIGLATMPKGRLIGMTTDDTGEATTRAQSAPIGEFWVNGDGRDGALRVSVEGQGDIPEGMSDPIEDDGVRLKVTWGGRTWRAESADRVSAVQLRFHLEQGAQLWECGWE
jgi:hypothetical protein